jgi:hypothetical protein
VPVAFKIILLILFKKLEVMRQARKKIFWCMERVNRAMTSRSFNGNIHNFSNKEKSNMKSRISNLSLTTT